MPSWVRPLLGVLAFADAVGLVVLVLGRGDVEATAASGLSSWRPLVPLVASVVLVVLSWWGSRAAEPQPGWRAVVTHAALAAATVLTLGAFVSSRGPGALLGAPGQDTVVVLAVNDVYRIEGLDGGKTGGLARLRTLRADLERSHPGRVLLLHGGDVIAPSLASRIFRGQQMIDVLNLLDGDPRAGWRDERMFAVLGNHEFDAEDCAKDSVLRQRVAQSDFYWLRSNVDFTPCPGGPVRIAGDNLITSALVDVGGLKVGLFGLTIDPNKKGLPFKFRNPHETAEALVAQLRERGADVVVAVTHLEAADDERLYRTLSAKGLSLVIGGHDHAHMSLPEAGPRIFKADADAPTAWVITLMRPAGEPLQVEGRLHRLADNVGKDPAVEGRVQQWMRAHDAAFCHRAAVDPDWLGDKPPDPVKCLDTPLAVTDTALIGSEERIRSAETSLGNWVADEMAAAFAGCRVEAAFINAGTLRLNQDVPAGSQITLRHLEELIGFPTTLRVYELTHVQLRDALTNAVSKWRDGRWLQVSGQLAFTYRPAPDGRAPGELLNVVVRPGNTPTAVTKESKGTVRVVTSEFLQKEATDGYVLPAPDETCKPALSDLKKLLREALRSHPRIAPKVEGRICTESESRERTCRVTNG